jgi:hypothetical protein
MNLVLNILASNRINEKWKSFQIYSFRYIRTLQLDIECVSICHHLENFKNIFLI